MPSLLTNLDTVLPLPSSPNTITGSSSVQPVLLNISDAFHLKNLIAAFIWPF